MRRRTFLGGALSLGVAGGAGRAAAQGFPTRPLRLVVPYPAGGATDVLARALAEGMGRRLGQQIVVENMPGANTAVGAAAVARAAGDGYTMLVGSGGSVVVNPLLYKNLAYDPDRDLRVLTVLAEVPLVLVVNPKVPSKTVQEFVAHTKQPGTNLNFASVGIGNPTHLAAELFMFQTGARMTHVPYRGSAPALNDLVGGQVEAMFDPISSSLGQIKGGNLKVLGVGSTTRLPVLPDVPTIAESGYPDYQAGVWFGLVVPKATPQDIAGRLAAIANEVQAEPAYRARLEAANYVIPAPRDAAGVAAFMAEDRKRWQGIIEAQNIRLD